METSLCAVRSATTGWWHVRICRVWCEVRDGWPRWAGGGALWHHRGNRAKHGVQAAAPAEGYGVHSGSEGSRRPVQQAKGGGPCRRPRGGGDEATPAEDERRQRAQANAFRGPSHGRSGLRPVAPRSAPTQETGARDPRRSRRRSPPAGAAERGDAGYSHAAPMRSVARHARAARGSSRPMRTTARPGTHRVGGAAGGVRGGRCFPGPGRGPILVPGKRAQKEGQTEETLSLGLL